MNQFLSFTYFLSSEALVVSRQKGENRRKMNIWLWEGGLEGARIESYMYLFPFHICHTEIWSQRKKHEEQSEIEDTRFDEKIKKKNVDSINMWYDTIHLWAIK